MRTLTYSLLISVLVLSACSAEKSRLSRINKEAIPKDVKAQEYVLLVQKPIIYNADIKLINKYMQQYPGKWEMVSEEQLKEAKYSDVNEYRYYLKPDAKYTYTVNYGSGHDFNYSFTDRKLRKVYPPTGLVMKDASWPIKYLAKYLRDM